MMIFIVKLLSIVLGLMVITKTYHDFKKGRESVTMFAFWAVAWIGIIVVSLFPEIIEKAIDLSKGERIGTGTFLGMSIVFLFFVIYRVYIKADRVEKNLVEVARKIAINKTDTEKQAKR